MLIYLKRHQAAVTEGKTATFWLTEQEFYLHKVEPEVDVPDTLVYVMNKDDFFF